MAHTHHRAEIPAPQERAVGWLYCPDSNPQINWLWGSTSQPTVSQTDREPASQTVIRETDSPPASRPAYNHVQKGFSATGSPL